MSDVIKRIADFVTGKDIDARHEKMSDAFKQAQNSQQIWAQTNEITRLRAQLHSEIVSHADMQKAYETERDVLREQRESLRADLAAVTAERDRMREVIKSINAMLEISCETLERPTYDSLEVGQRHNPLSQKEIIQRFTETCSFVRADLLRTMDEARAALEGVTEPATGETYGQ